MNHYSPIQNPDFLEVIIDEKFKVLPKLAVNKPVEEQEPELTREELQSAMIIDILPGAGSFMSREEEIRQEIFSKISRP